MFMMYTFCRSELMYTKCIQNVCIKNVSRILRNFCTQNVYKMFVYKMYPTFRQTFVYILCTNFSWHSSFDFVYKMYTKVCGNVGYILYTFCIHFVYILYNFCIQKKHMCQYCKAEFVQSRNRHSTHCKNRLNEKPKLKCQKC